MNLLKNSSVMGVGSMVGAAGLLIVLAGAELPLFATVVATTALLLAFIAIVVNTYRNARPDRTMGRLLHDPEPHRSSERARKVPAWRSGAR
jgi:hypothetical protein